MVEALLLTTALTLGQMSDDDYVAPASTYVFAQTQRVDVGGGLTRVSAENSIPIPRHGYFPLRVFVNNTLGPRQVLRVGFHPSGVGGRAVVKNVELLAGERRTVVLPVPYLFRYGMLKVRGPGVTERGEQNLYFTTTYAPQRSVLSLGTTEEFEKWVGKAPAHSSGDLNVLSLAPGDAPTELAAYTGYDTVVVPDTQFELLNEAPRRALESWAATGGTLVLGKGGRGLSAALPLLKGEVKRDQSYGLGRLVVCENCGGGLGTYFSGHPQLVTPHSAGGTSSRPRHGRSPVEFSALLPQATAPIGRFLLIITLFTLAIGPGSIWVARRRGPAALLLTIPATAFLTCSAIIGYSVIQDGFTVHASTRGLTLLDGKQHRALNLGLTAYYANLAPGTAHFSQLVAVLPPGEGGGDTYGLGIEWGENATVSGDFVPSRTYREWGYVSSEPTRARVVIKRENGGWVMQNALGFAVKTMVFLADDAEWTVTDVRDGAEGTAQKKPHGLPSLEASVADRFSAAARNEVERPLKEGEFLALVEGQAFAPSGGLRLSQHDSAQLVRGEVEK